MDRDSFFSVENLMEFGMSMVMARQMVNMMNQTLQPTTPQTLEQIFYVAIDGQQIGPLGSNELMQMIQQGSVNKDTLSWIPGMTAWQPIERVPAILKLIAMIPPKLPTL